LIGGAGNDDLGGGRGGDRLDGGSGDDRLAGGRSGDWIAGHAGDDRIVGGPGRDSLRGWGGDDIVDAVDFEADDIRCGPGQDTAMIDEFDTQIGCESVSLAIP
jgi:Ca2+-binding RTX toxin-like protein